LQVLIGVPKEIKVEEYRVGLTPASVREVVAHGHKVMVERGAGNGIGALDADYQAAGAELADSAEEVFARAELLVKVKEPQAMERKLLRQGQVLFTYLHLAPDPDQCHDLVASGAVCIAYETVTQPGGGLPLLAPMSEVAGRMSIQVGARFLEKPQGGRGILLGGVTGVAPAKVVILGAGTVGSNAALIAVGNHAQVVVLDSRVEALRRVDGLLGTRVNTLNSDQHNIEEQVAGADLVIGAALIPGGMAPKLVERKLVARMKPGSVIVDVAIDQGGCFETSRPTTHAKPIYVVDGVVHYCVANMPGAVPHTSTYALNNATLPFVLQIADQGWRQALVDNPCLREGLNVCNGAVTHRAVADALGYLFQEPAALLTITTGK
jgi:alanine dehydrogenase